ncbi:phosphonate ABC transporter substrate-binding protein [Neosynechococcus sphagnicola sy1]|uniref:Phosphonate ABC transporter substrate-binding protein n=1 Tax=Neosynechococcus sphagnicola sy1 TaxID=1497020 RepID=A0A098TJN5_9CYAN|nr:PhnD/SsuA/transferrin family substrate-binding protein [Neosynechococcus sphagnicola]KGF72431.1 phosphonate ABC transporter substrate-binding protein [Neosynechococcus sphagnicola sy1]
MIPRRLLLYQILALLSGCAALQTASQNGSGKLTIGIVTYGEGNRSLDQYQQFLTYLSGQLRTQIELEPAYNEVKALEQIQRQAWSLVFAPPGLTAIAIAKAQYHPLFPLQGVNNLHSVLVVLQDSPMKQISDLANHRVALTQPGSATGYYLPLYDLYGLTLAAVQIAPTPQKVLEWVDQGAVTAGAMAQDEFARLRPQFPVGTFRVLHTSRKIPPGAVLISPSVERNQQQLIQQAMNAASPAIATEAGYVPNAPPPDYGFLIRFIEKVKPIETHIHEQPAPLFQH